MGCCQLFWSCSSKEVAGPQKLVVAAASDLQRVVEPLSKAYTAHPVQFVLGSTGVLARQIEAGAPYDVFLAANQAYVERLVRSGRLEQDTVRTYAIGRLGFWSRSGLRWNALPGAPIRQLAMANPAHAPYGRAARQALERAGWWDSLEPRIVYGENVRQALQFAETGNADAVITAWSLVRDRGGELIDSRLHDPLRQAAGVVRASARNSDARAFVEWLNSDAAQNILRNHGFEKPGR